VFNQIVLIDDDEDDQLIFLTALKAVAPHCKCHIKNNGPEALQELRNLKENPDIIFLDLNMPKKNGFEFLAMLKKDDRFSDIPVIIFSTSEDPWDIKRAKRLGAMLYITKTGDIQSIRKNLDSIINM
jgi:CheY-like chemotaxis protein